MSAPFAPSVLAFHHVSPDIAYYTNTPPAAFERQVRWLARRYSFWTVSEALEAMHRGERAEGRVIVTFDDGYEDNLLHAAPVLAKHGVRATFFVLPDFCARLNTWNKRASYRARHLSWSQIRALADDGHEIASHGLTHRPAIDLAVDESEREMRLSKGQLEARLGCPVRAYAFPYGIVDRRLGPRALGLYDATFSTVKSARTDWRESLHALRRDYVPATAGEDELEEIVTTRRHRQEILA